MYVPTNGDFVREPELEGQQQQFDPQTIVDPPILVPLQNPR